MIPIFDANLRNKKDLYADLGLAFGFSDTLPYVKRRRRKTEEIINKLEPEKFYLVGHSLGGYTVKQSLKDSKKIRNKLTEAHTFNAGANAIFNDNLKVNKKIKKQLEDKVTHHRINGDLVSASLKSFIPFGKVQNYKLKEKNEKEGQNILNKALTFNPVLKQIKNLTSKAIDAHHIDNFYKKDLIKINKKQEKEAQVIE